MKRKKKARITLNQDGSYYAYNIETGEVIIDFNKTIKDVKLKLMDLEFEVEVEEPQLKPVKSQIIS